MRKTFEQLIQEHGEWADATFPKGTAKGAMIHAGREAIEVIEDCESSQSKDRIATECADFMGCVFDSLRRDRYDVGSIAQMLDFLCNTDISLTDIRNQFARKLQINKARQWRDNGDGSYSHIKTNL